MSDTDHDGSIIARFRDVAWRELLLVRLPRAHGSIVARFRAVAWEDLAPEDTFYYLTAWSGSNTVHGPFHCLGPDPSRRGYVQLRDLSRGIFWLPSVSINPFVLDDEDSVNRRAPRPEPVRNRRHIDTAFLACGKDETPQPQPDSKEQP